MHELSIAQAVLEIACRHAAGRRVTRVDLKIGHLRQVVPAALTFGFDLLAQGTAVEGAQLVVQSVPVEAVCQACNRQNTFAAFPFQCEFCNGWDLEIVAGEELEVESIEVQEEDDIASSPFENVGR